MKLRINLQVDLNPDQVVEYMREGDSYETALEKYIVWCDDVIYYHYDNIVDEDKEAFRRAVLKEFVENFRELDDGKNDGRT